ncbi:TRAP transporter small permease, partial [Methanothrix soehngenii]|uniref:TRAP transporter small permease n=1 Tax=Methanothrix soehngenii TaxID=2223 RepID=UPI002FE344F2
MKSNDRFKVVDQVIIQIFKWICIVTFAAIMVLVTANVLLRYIPITSINWYSEIVELCFAWMIFYGAA